MITNRTQEDVDNLDLNSTTPSKGAYNYTDLNRVEAKVKELSDLLTTYSYMSSLTTKLDWTYSDFFTSQDATRYLNNVKVIRNALATYEDTPQVPSTMANLTYQGANDIEKILIDIEVLLISMENWFVYSGVSNSGQNRLWQNRFRHYFAYPSYDDGDYLTTETGDVLTTESGDELEFESVPYTMLDWIESTGTQWIDTGILNSATIKVETKMSTIGGTTSLVCGSEYTSNYRFKWGTNGAGSVYYGYGGNNHNISATTSLATPYTYYMSNGSQWVKDNYGTIIASSSDGALSYYSTKPIALFSCWSDATNNIAQEPTRIYYCKIWDSDTLVRDLIPVLDETNATPCFYDKVSETYFYSQGTGSFVPSETETFTTITYLASNGTQYIDTGFKHNQNTRMVANIVYNSSDLRTFYPFGSFGGTSGNQKWFCAGTNGSSQMQFLYNTSGYTFTNLVATSLKHYRYDFNKNVATINGTSTAMTSATFQSIYNDLIFGVTNYTGGVSTKAIETRVYNFKIYDNGTLVREFIPVIRKSDNVPCLYDLVSNTFYTNAGTGNFLYG